MTATRTPGLDREWERLTQNPDNVIVSDSIRGAVMQLLEPDEPPPPPPGAPTVLLVSDQVTVSMRALRVETGALWWSVVGLALVTDGETVISSNPETWQRLDLVGSSGQTLRSWSLAGSSHTKDVEFSHEDGTCTVRISCDK